MRRDLLGIVLLAAVSAIGGCKSKPPAPTPATPSQQAAAMQLGFATGSFMAQYTQPLDVRQVSFGKFGRTDSDLHDFMARISITESDATPLVASLLDGFGDPNPERGGPLLTQSVNDIMQRLSAGPNPELFYVFRIGFTLAYEVETIDGLSQGTPQPEHVQPYLVKSAKYRENLAPDLEQAGLPQDLAEAIQGAAIDVRSAPDLFAVTRAVLKVKGLIGQLQQ